MGSTLYARDQGPICYETQLLDLDNKSSLKDFIQQLLTASICWHWASIRTEEVGEDSEVKDLPEIRPYAHLRSNTAEDLFNDILEENQDRYGRGLVIIGVDPDLTIPTFSREWLSMALEAFLQKEEGSIKIILIRIGDMREQYIFIPHNPIAPVKKLLERCGVIPSSIVKSRKYEHLRLVKLESLSDSILNLATNIEGDLSQEK